MRPTFMFTSEIKYILNIFWLVLLQELFFLIIIIIIIMYSVCVAALGE